VPFAVDPLLPAATGVDPLGIALALFLGTFASEDLTCIAAGALAMQDAIPLPLAVLACALGIFVSDLALYGAGRLGVRGLVHWQWLQRRLPTAGGTAANWRRTLDRHGFKLLFLSRFLPGTRLPAYVAAGAIGWSLPRFALALGIGAAIWTPILVGTAYVFGESVQAALGDYGNWAWLGVPLALLAAFLCVRIGAMLSTWRGRRLLYGRWLRLRRWEYWPIWAVYPPVVVVLSWTALRHRRALLFTACNPGIPLGGLALESKGDILAQLPLGAELPVAVAPYDRLRGGEDLDTRLAVVAARLAHGPVVLKPDQGERGQGVAVVRSLAHARRWLQECPGDAIAQEFVGGCEYGVGWRRRPDGRTEIRSLTHKVPPQLQGDGEHTLEELILRDERTLPLAARHFARHADRLLEVPAAGESVVLGELGTHARGATFYDVRSLRTAALEQAFADAMQHAVGLDFGRFDVRVPSASDLQAGRNIRILEFNGVTGEPTHIYQPGYPWWRGICDLCGHWLAAVANGAANVQRGHRAATAREGLAMLRAVRRRRQFEAPAAPGAESRQPQAGPVVEPVPPPPPSQRP
jgi:membrane protein DedA with SNARE-associated domain